MIRSKDIFLDQQINEHMQRIERAQIMSQEERYALRKFERLTKPIVIKSGKIRTERISK